MSIDSDQKVMFRSIKCEDLVRKIRSFRSAIILEARKESITSEKEIRLFRVQLLETFLNEIKCVARA